MFRWNILIMNLCNKYYVKYVLGIGNKAEKKIDRVFFFGVYFLEVGDRVKIRKGIYDCFFLMLICFINKIKWCDRN